MESLPSETEEVRLTGLPIECSLATEAKEVRLSRCSLSKSEEVGINRCLAETKEVRVTATESQEVGAIGTRETLLQIGRATESEEVGVSFLHLLESCICISRAVISDHVDDFVLFHGREHAECNAEWTLGTL